MVGTSGTEAYKTYHYYTCTKARAKQCTKKSVQQKYIEDLVVTETKNILTKENITIIAKDIVDLYNHVSNTETLKQYKSQLKKNEKAIRNLLKAIETGVDNVTILLTQQIADKQKEQAKIKMRSRKKNLVIQKLPFSR